MKHITMLYEQLCEENKAHKDEIFNYTIPESWDLYGYTKRIVTKQKEYIVNPYEFTLFTLDHILANPAQPLKNKDWYKESVLYYQITRLNTAWDHDRTSSLEQDNLYHLNDHGTFLKAILRLPFYQRMGINTILLSSPFQLGKGIQHEFANPNACASFQQFDSCLKDPLLTHMTLEQQYLAFEECAHHLGFHIIWQVDFCTLARDNEYIKEHPEWFYWINKAHLYDIHAPQVSYLSQNCLPEKEIIDLIEHSEDFLYQQSKFQEVPTKGKDLNTHEKEHNLTTVPFVHDRINSSLPIEYEYTPLRFYKDSISTNPITLRCDMYPGKQKNTSLWNMLKTSLKNVQDTYSIDGFYFTRSYLYPQELLRSLLKIVKDKGNVVILEETNQDNIELNKFTCDGISGNSGYVEYDVWNHQLHNFAYRLKDNQVPVFAGAEFLDTLRITQYDGYALASMLHVLNMFLPNTVPFYVNGMECMEPQPLLLSHFQNQASKNALPDLDPRFQKQPCLDSYYFEYRSDGIYMLPNLLEQVSSIRKKYLSAICDSTKCIPLWFNSPKDSGIGFAYKNQSSILLVVANTDFNQNQTLSIHMDNVLSQDSHTYTNIHQIYSTKDPFVYDIEMSESHIIPLLFQPGEVKFIELS